MIAIIADDLTGANDSGLQFSAHGLDTTVFLGDAPAGLLEGSAVAVVDTETRALPAERVADAVAKAADRLRSAGAEHVYKKIDSTMRGHVGLELATVARRLDAATIFMTPAFPAMKRTVEGGRLLVDGVFIDQTSLARDPAWPVREPDLVRLVGRGLGGMRCISLGTDALASASALQAALAGARAGAGEVEQLCAIFNARNDDDLERLAVTGAAWAEQQNETVLWAGSAGLAAHLPKAWGVPARQPKIMALPAATRPPLLIVGSVNPVAIRQLDGLIAATGAGPVVMSPEPLLGAARERKAEVARASASLRLKIGEDRWPLILTSAHGREDIERIASLAARSGLSRSEAGQRIAAGMAEAACGVLAEDAVNRLVTTGGDISFAVMSAAGVSAVTVEGAIEPGIPVVTTRSGPRRHIVTKAGGFGSPRALARAVAFLTHGRLD